MTAALVVVVAIACSGLVVGVEGGSQQAQPAPAASDDTAAIDAGWLLTSAYLVFCTRSSLVCVCVCVCVCVLWLTPQRCAVAHVHTVMQAGFAMLEAGTTRAKNIKNILLKVLLLLHGRLFVCLCSHLTLYGGLLCRACVLDHRTW
jgi:hypothetical protein